MAYLVAALHEALATRGADVLFVVLVHVDVREDVGAFDELAIASWKFTNVLGPVAVRALLVEFVSCKLLVVVDAMNRVLTCRCLLARSLRLMRSFDERVVS